MAGYTTERLERWIDRSVVDARGRRVGTIADVYVDDSTGSPEWLAVMTGLFGSRISFVPLAGAVEEGQKVRIAYAKATVKASPEVSVDGQLTGMEEERLYRHYDLPYRESAVIDATDTGIGAMQEKGSAALNGEISPDVARARIAERDAAAIDAIDLRSDEEVRHPPYS
jgi:sporulation protein YlmC with PRC-barrel domain